MNSVFLRRVDCACRHHWKLHRGWNGWGWRFVSLRRWRFTRWQNDIAEARQYGPVFLFRIGGQG